MSTGNTYGLGEISHYGAFQRVGGKAGGFINKKFFHPSSMRNQEKLWLAMTADEREQRKEVELQKRRDEERQVEELRKQMYLSGQGKASDLASKAIAQESAERLSASEKSDQKAAIEEQQRRRALLRREKVAREGLEDDPDASGDEEDLAGNVDGERELAQSRYEEDVYVGGHRSVWGSWYSEDHKQWGFACCKIRDLNEECPLKPEEVEEQPTKAQPRKRRRRRGKAGEAAEEGGEPGEEDEPTIKGGLQGAHASVSANETQEPASLIDPRLLEAAEMRREKRKLEERREEEKKSSGYLADLLLDPIAG